MLDSREAWDTVEKAIAQRGEYNESMLYLALPPFQNELACRIWRFDMPSLRARFYDTKCDFPTRVNRLPKLSTITRKVRDKDFWTKDESPLALLIKAIFEERPYLIPPKQGHDEEWLYQNETVIRTWAAAWNHFDRAGVTFEVDKKTYSWTPAEYGNPFAKDLQLEKMHHIMKHEMVKVMTIERDRRHIQDTGKFTKEIAAQQMGFATLSQFS